MSEGSEYSSKDARNEGPLRISQPSASFTIDGHLAQQSDALLHEDSASKADLDFWSRMATWTIEEGISLSFEKDPEIVTWDSLENLAHSPFAQQYSKIRKLALRALDAGKLCNPCHPLEFIHWMKQNRMPFSERLISAVSEHLDYSRNWNPETTLSTTTQPQAEDETVNHKSFNTLLKLVGGLVVAIYKYDASAKKSDIPRQIQSDLDLLGLNFDVDTIRKWAKEGVRAAEII